MNNMVRTVLNEFLRIVQISFLEIQGMDISSIQIFLVACWRNAGIDSPLMSLVKIPFLWKMAPRIVLLTYRDAF